MIYLLKVKYASDTIRLLSPPGVHFYSRRSSSEREKDHCAEGKEDEAALNERNTCFCPPKTNIRFILAVKLTPLMLLII